MRISAFVPALALAASVALSGPAFAQEQPNSAPDFTVRGTTIPGENAPDFRQKCHLLYIAQLESLTNDVSAGEDVTGSVPTSNADPASQKHQLELLASISVQECREAGLL